MPPWALAQVSEFTTPLVRERTRPGKGPPRPRGPSMGPAAHTCTSGGRDEVAPLAAPLVARLVAPPLVAPPIAEDREQVAPPSSLASGWLSSPEARTPVEPWLVHPCTARRGHATAGAGVRARTWADDDDLGLLGQVRATKDTMPSRATHAGHAVGSRSLVQRAAHPARDPARERRGWHRGRLQRWRAQSKRPHHESSHEVALKRGPNHGSSGGPRTQCEWPDAPASVPWACAHKKSCRQRRFVVLTTFPSGVAVFAALGPRWDPHHAPDRCV